MAIAVDGDEIEIIGAGAIAIIDVSNLSQTNLREFLHDEALAIYGAKLHIVPDDYRFSLQQRQCIC